MPLEAFLHSVKRPSSRWCGVHAGGRLHPPPQGEVGPLVSSLLTLATRFLHITSEAASGGLGSLSPCIFPRHWQFQSLGFARRPRKPGHRTCRGAFPALISSQSWRLSKQYMGQSHIFMCGVCCLAEHPPPKKRLRKWAGLPHVVGTQDVPICLLLWGDTLARSWSLDPRRTSLKRQESARFTGCRLESPLPSASLFLPLTPWTNEPHRGRRGPDLGWNPFLPSATRKFPLHWVLSLLCPNFQEPPWRWICPVPWGPHKGVESPVLRNLHLSPLPITLKIQPRGSPLLLLVLPANVWSPSRFQNTYLYGCIEY